jgi:thiosulfate/3-mercaptopyruvate sulfurtransferase
MRPMIKEYAGMILIGLLFLAGFGAAALFIERETTPDLVTPIVATPFLQGDPDLMVDVPWLVSNIGTVDLVIDLSDKELYERGHIPGAVHVWWEDAMPWHAANYGEGGALSDPAEASLTLEYPQDARIVVYDNNDSERASWFLWLLRTNGYGNAVLLDGGYGAWIGAGQPSSTEASSLETVASPTPTWIAANEIETGELAERLDDPALVIIDARTPEQQRDTVNETVRVGQIPGSWSIAAPSVMREDGTFRSPDELRELFAPLGLQPDSEIVVYGRFGTETGRVWLALHLAGYHNLRVYDDGWVHWGWNTDLPIEPVGTAPRRPATPAATPLASPAATPVQ